MKNSSFEVGDPNATPFCLNTTDCELFSEYMDRLLQSSDLCTCLTSFLLLSSRRDRIEFYLTVALTFA